MAYIENLITIQQQVNDHLLLFHLQQINPIAATSVNYFRTLQNQYMLFSLLKDA